MSRIENIKYLRQIGASLRLQDDVAARVGGYDSPLFVPTVEFIMKLQNSFLSTSQQQEMGITTQEMPNTFDPQAFKGVDLDIASDIIKADDMPATAKLQAANYVGQMVDARDKFIEQNPDFDAEKNLIPQRKKNKRQSKQQEKQVKKSALASMIASAVKTMNEKIGELAENMRQNTQQSSLNSGAQSNSQQANQQNAARAKDPSKRNIMSLFRLKKAIAEHHEHHDEQHQQQDKSGGKNNTKRDDFLKKLKQDVRIKALQEQQERMGFNLKDDDLMEAAKAAKHQHQQAENMSREMLVSNMIRIIENNAKAKSKESKPKEANIDEAVAKLSATGVKSVGSEQQIDNKKALEEHGKPSPDQRFRG